MNNIYIKICGIQSPEIAHLAVQLGANYIGIVFHPESKRFVNIQLAREISSVTQEIGAKPVAVFVNHSAEEMYALCQETDINMIQLHGKISRSQHHLLPVDYQRIYVQPVKDTGKTIDVDDGLRHCNSKRDFILFDHSLSGSGKSFNWKHFNYHNSYRWFLAGGLTCENVIDGIKQLQPNGVDVSSGVENIFGKKDFIRIKEFINRVQSQCGDDK